MFLPKLQSLMMPDVSACLPLTRGEARRRVIIPTNTTNWATATDTSTDLPTGFRSILICGEDREKDRERERYDRLMGTIE